MTPEPISPGEPPTPEKVPPDLLAWARQTFDEEEFMAGVRKIRAAGVCCEDFLAEVERKARGGD